ncbi:MAG: EAL domain-containing protein [Gammaproteobacteria bacterium]|nr:EAL domain-containing protein [Gammaproteobacteria bacterium]
MKLRPLFTMRRAWWLGLLIALVAAGLLARGDLRAAHASRDAEHLIAELIATDTRLDAAVLHARMASYPNYDPMNAELGRLAALRAHLGARSAALQVGDEPTLVAALAALDAHLGTMDALADDFRRSNSTAKNSLQYFPEAVSDVLVAGGRDAALVRTMLPLLSHAMLVYLGEPSPQNAEKITRRLSAIESGRGALEAATTAHLDLALRHARLLLDVVPRLEAATQRLAETGPAPELRQLAELFSTLHWQWVARVYAALAVFAIAVLVLAGFLARLAQAHVGELRLASTVFDASPAGIMITDPQGRILKVNPAFSRISGFTPADAVGNSPSILRSDRQPPSFYAAMWAAIRELGHWSGEIWNRRKNGEHFPEWLSINAVRRPDDEEITHYVAVFIDSTPIHDAEEKIRYLAYHDALTGLPNRRVLADRVEQALHQAARRREIVTLMLIDLDNFKNINDTLGHLTGDRLLVQIASRLRESFREVDTVCRLGGDEFVFFPQEVRSVADAEHIASKLVALIAEPVAIDGRELSVSASIGIAQYPTDGGDYDTLLRQADAAMYRAKRRGRNCWSFSAHDEDAGLDDYVVLHGALAHAVRTGEGLSVHYQPKISLADGRVVGMEALARWTHPELGPVGPARFIPIAESSGLIVPLGAKILMTACREARAWDALGLSISVNTSAIQFRRVDDLMASVTEALETSGLPPERLEIELTESTMMDNLAQSEDALRRLKQRGLRVAIDDFGIGYSSLAYLHWLDIDVLKIDQSFVRDLETSPDAAAIACAVIQLARALNMETVAEGIETAGQLAFLKTQGCDVGQGMRFRAPMPADEVPRFLAEWQRAGVEAEGDGAGSISRAIAPPRATRGSRDIEPDPISEELRQRG